MTKWVGIFLVSIPIVCAILAKFGFQGREHVVGIDLGTTYSVIGVLRKGNVIIIPDGDGNLLTPSTVAFLEGGDILVGRSAREHMNHDPKHTIFNAKRFIGRSFQDPVVQSETQMYDFAIKENKTEGAAPSQVCFGLELKSQPSCVSPITVGGLIIKKLKAIASIYLGHNQITGAVIAVPADFDTEQRKATAMAFEEAGLRVLRILDEPTSAAVAYGLHKKDNVHYVVVYDLGGGTLDVSLLYIQNENVQVMATAGDNKLGGEDFDQMLAFHLKNQFEIILKHPINTQEEYLSYSKEKHNFTEVAPCTSSGIRFAAEKLKRDLSSTLSASTSCRFVHKDNTERLASIEVSRNDFEETCMSLLKRSMDPVYRVLEENRMTAKKVDKIVLVGGSSRIPWIRKELAAIFGQEKLNYDIDPDVAVAYGAARIVD